MLRDLIRFWWRRDDESATVMCIIAANFMRRRSRRDIAEYMHSMNEADDASEQRAARTERGGE